MTSTWRMLTDGPATGQWNMAVDEAVFKSVEAGTSPPTLRFYRWEPPAVSLGFGQVVAKSVNERVLADEGIDLVRRPTGGKAVLHHDEVTYSISARHGELPEGRDLLDVYRLVAEAFASGLRRLGLKPSLVPRTKGSTRQKTAVCFEVPASYEVLLEGRKVLGSAQRRTRRGFLQHGSLPLSMDLNLLYRCLHPGEERAPEESEIARWREEMAGLADVAGGGLGWEAVVEALAHGVSERLGVSMESGVLSPEEKALAEALKAEKYANPHWTFRR